MNTQFHTPSFGDEVFELGNIGGATSTSTPISGIATGNIITNNKSYMYQQQTPQSATQTKRMISLHNTSDEYHTANEESFTTANTNLINTTNNGQQQPTGVNSIVTTPTTTMAARKQMLPPNEPAKPLSAYALFFRDTVSAIKQQNPSCTFQELSKIVASMWDALDPVHKIVYNKKNELARNEYLNQMRVYRQQLEQQQQQTEAQEQIHEQNSNSDTNTPIISTPQQQQQQQQQQLTAQQVATNNAQLQQNPQTSTNSNSAVSSTNVTSSTAPPADEQIRLLTEAGSVQKCTRESCTKRAIINPDWEDEYCSNECVVIHCRNVFNEWVQSNLEAKQQQQQQQQQQQSLQQQPNAT